MLRGQLWATSDINVVNQALTNGFKVIFLGDPISIDPIYKDKFTVGISLIPDYQTMSMQVDGNDEAFIRLYTASLNSKAAVAMLSVIFACLFRGTNIMFYLPPEAQGLNYAEYLLQFIEYNYGVRTQTRTTQFSFDMKYSDRIIELLYLDNLVTAHEFLLNSTNLNENTLRKLVNELHPMVRDPHDLKQIVQWFSDFKDALIAENKPLINGIQYAGSDYVCC